MLIPGLVYRRVLCLPPVKMKIKMKITKGAMNLDLNPIYNVASFH
jgi:hypothetical protein